ncbi:MAG: hypothetical protein WBE90_05615 [Xanthobacteraceae bacterium]
MHDKPVSASVLGNIERAASATNEPQRISAVFAVPRSISKRGDRYLCSLFTTGALAVIRYAKIHGTKHRPWLTALHHGRGYRTRQ